ncbi:ABC transporter ATP-binding protein [Lactobacillus corticis]|uniref:ABC transporter ATP-binding protein n=1 Tax=Lactobacillus corticis TaxID=2201249 RepID=A0A916QJ64_9LACO|nr:ATP-binding cassette domain-containing protein [Lactobacillus corticis]GFZ27488.1 ABC transporter ATP-binding protein [Lactobacillus corticis]
MLFELHHVAYRTHDTKVLQDISFNIEAGSTLTLTGPSGSGKSTILRLLANLISPSEGEILYQGQKTTSYQPDQYRQRVSYCFQQPTLFGETVKDNLAFPFAIRKQAFDEAKCLARLKEVDLSSNFLGKKITQLSGGEKQRVALIRNVLFEPEVLLLDEVTTGLDDFSKQQVHQLIKNEQERGVTIVQITHDQSELAEAKLQLHVENGRISQ